jgi:hypothetical protein
VHFSGNGKNLGGPAGSNLFIGPVRDRPGTVTTLSCILGRFYYLNLSFTYVLVANNDDFSSNDGHTYEHEQDDTQDLINRIRKDFG